MDDPIQCSTESRPSGGGAPGPGQALSMEADRCRSAYRWMVLARVLDDKLASLYRGGKIHGGVFLSRGQEALSAAIGVALQRGDIFAPLIRDTAGRLAFGETVAEALRTCLGSPLGPMRARDGNVHRGRPRDGLLPMISHLGAMIAVVNGMLLARRLQGRPGSVGAACLGDGGTSTGSFHEGINQAAIERLPLVLVIADNQYAYSTPTCRQFACQSLVDRAVGYGVQGHLADGTDLLECMRVLADAVGRARSGQGPQMVVARLLRLCGHGEHDDASYVDPALKESELGRDCLQVAEEILIGRGWATAADLAGWRHDAQAQIEAALAEVQRDPQPDPYQETWTAIASEGLRDGYPAPPA